MLPEDDAGREDLELLLYPVSLGPDPARRMRNVTEGHAPWALPNADGFSARILHKPTWERRLTSAPSPKISTTRRRRMLHRHQHEVVGFYIVILIRSDCKMGLHGAPLAFVPGAVAGPARCGQSTQERWL